MIVDINPASNCFLWNEYQSMIDEYRKAIDWGVDLIQTDHPLRVRSGFGSLGYVAERSCYGADRFSSCEISYEST